MANKVVALCVLLFVGIALSQDCIGPRGPDGYIGLDVYKVDDYGGVPDAVVLFDGVVRATEDTLRSAIATFTSADVGKRICIAKTNADSSDDTGRVVQYVNANKVRVSFSADVYDTLATVIYGTDNTTFAQAAINAAFLAGGGTVRFSVGGYLLAGPLQTSVSGSNPNSQLYIPLCNINTSIQVPKIVIEGAPTSPINGLNIDNIKPRTGGTRIYSIIQSNGTGAILGTPWVATSWGSYVNYTDVVVRDINFTVRQNEHTTGINMSGINLQKLGTGHVENVSVTGDRNTAKRQPTLRSVGIWLGHQAGDVYSMKNVFSMGGFYYGVIVPAEHVKLDLVYSLHNEYGLVITPGCYWLTGHVVPHWCKVQIYFAPNGFLGVVGNTGKTRVRLTVDTENWVSEEWNATLYTVCDSGNVAIGEIRYVNNVAGTNNQTPLVKYGGKNLLCYGENENLPMWTTTTRPTLNLGVIGYNTTLGAIEYYNGSAWVGL